MLALDLAVLWQMEHRYEHGCKDKPSPASIQPACHQQPQRGQKCVPNTHPSPQQSFRSGTWLETILCSLPLSAGRGRSIQRVIHPPILDGVNHPLKAAVSPGGLKRNCRQLSLNRRLTLDL